MKKGWMAVVMGALLVGTLIGVVWARPGQGAQAAGGTRKLTIPAAFFHPVNGDEDYENTGNAVWVKTFSGAFVAPVVFPCKKAVTVERVILSVSDFNGTEDACVSLYRTKPSKGTGKLMAHVCSADSPPGVTNYTDDTISSPRIWPGHGPFLRLDVGGTNIAVFGVRIEYHIGA
jgi:hypothetical protein